MHNIRFFADSFNRRNSDFQLTHILLDTKESSGLLDLNVLEEKKPTLVDRLLDIQEKLNRSEALISFNAFYPRRQRSRLLLRDLTLCLSQSGLTALTVYLMNLFLQMTHSFKENSQEAKNIYDHQPQIELGNQTCLEVFGASKCESSRVQKAVFKLLNMENMLDACVKANEDFCSVRTIYGMWFGVALLGCMAIGIFAFTTITMRKRFRENPLSRITQDDINFLEEHKVIQQSQPITSRSIQSQIKLRLLRELLPQGILPSSERQLGTISNIIAGYLDEEEARLFMTL